MFRRNFLLSCAGVLGTTTLARAASIELRLLGDVSSSGGVMLTDDDLLALPQVSFDTETIWTAGVKTFSGPSVAAVLAFAGAGPGDLRLEAVNGYSVNMARSMVGANAPIIANRIDGAPFARRQKGPLWIMFPFSSDEAFRTEITYTASVWQLNQITVLAA